MNSAGEYKAWWDLGSSDQIHKLGDGGYDPLDNDSRQVDDTVLDDMYRYY